MIDASSRAEILDLLGEHQEARRLSYLYITHDLASARYVADEILVLYAGQVVEQGPTDKVLLDPLHPYTQLLLSAVPNPGAGLLTEELPERKETVFASRDAEGCRFVDRCPFAFETCGSVAPQLVGARTGHDVRCHLFPQPTTSRGSES
jgi:peptide/nickel transport system ATP-binding protein